MKYRKFKIKDIVRCVSNNVDDEFAKNKLGKIIDIDKRWTFTYLVEFFEPIENGHDGYNGIGKHGYCWTFFEEDIELHISILKLFLKEKQNEQI